MALVMLAGVTSWTLARRSQGRFLRADGDSTPILPKRVLLA